MRNILLEIQYNGTCYKGFQAQNDQTTIEKMLLIAIEKVFEQKVKIHGTSRTDASVSAYSYYLSFEVDSKLPVDRIPFKMNRFLPKDISVLEAYELKSNIPANKLVKNKTYYYSFYSSVQPKPLLNKNCLWVKEELDIHAMEEACSKIIGTHDFTGFKSTSSEDLKSKKNPIKTVIDARIIKQDDIIIFSITADAFLYNMVRILAGTILLIGKGEAKPSLIDELFISLDRTKAGDTLPARALLLKSMNIDKSYIK